MRSRKLATIAALVAVAGSSIVGVGQARAAESPQTHFALVGTKSFVMSWDTNGATGCVLHSTEGTRSGELNVNGPGHGGQFTPTTGGTAQLKCDGGVNSPVARYYGPRNPLNDARTVFNDATKDAFGS